MNDENSEMKKLGVNKNVDPFSVNDTHSLTEYVRNKISDIQALDLEISNMERILKDRVMLRDRRVAEEVEQLRRVTGMDHLQSKVRGLSHAANKELLEE